MDVSAITAFQAIAASGTALLVAIGAIAKWYLPYRSSTRKRTGFLEGLKSLRSIYSSFDRAASVNAQCCILFGGHNAGGAPRAAAPFHISPYHWRADPDHPINVEDFQDLVLDASYISMLLDIWHKPYYRFDCAETRSLLGRIYASEHVKDSIIIFLAIHNNVFFYVSFRSYVRLFTEDEITSLILISNTLSREIKAQTT